MACDERKQGAACLQAGDSQAHVPTPQGRTCICRTLGIRSIVASCGVEKGWGSWGDGAGVKANI